MPRLAIYNVIFARFALKHILSEFDREIVYAGPTSGTEFADRLREVTQPSEG